MRIYHPSLSVINASSNLHSPCCQRPRDNWHHTLVRSATSPSMAQPSNEEHPRAAGVDDVSLVRVWSSFRGVCDCAELQHSDSSPAAVFLSAVFDQLGPVSKIRLVSLNKARPEREISSGAGLSFCLMADGKILQQVAHLDNQLGGNNHRPVLCRNGDSVGLCDAGPL